MKKGFKTAVVSILTVATSTGICFAQGYNPTYTTTPGANYNLNQTYQGQQYTPQQYPPVRTYPQQQPPQQNMYPPQYNPYTPVNAYPLKGGVVTVPMGSSIPAYSTSEISSEFLTTGDSVAVMLASDYYFNGMLVAPANSMVNGNVVIGEKAGYAGKNGKLKIRFTNIVTPTGQRIPISGKLMTEDGTGILVGGTTKDRAVKAVKNVAIGSGLGALAGTIFGPLSGGKAGRGAAMGTAVGAGLGLGKVGIDKGLDAMIEPNTPVNIILDQPLVVSPNSGYQY